MKSDGASDRRGLRILLIAYEFPPSPSPQSLRWAYLAGRLAAFGHELHVMAPDLAGDGQGLPDPAQGVCVHRVWPGPAAALLGRLARRKRHDPAHCDPRPTSGGEDLFAGLGAIQPAYLNWKGRLLERVQDAASWLLFPDQRGEWAWPARRALPGLLSRIRPDVVITSHEPATTLALGLEARRRGFRWVADLGDPVLAGYTPRRWRRRARRLEGRAMREADHVLVTTTGTRALLQERHPAGAPITVVPQGFDESVAVAGSRPAGGRPVVLELLYAGRFYPFRDPRPLVEGVLQVPGVRLNIASVNAPDWLVRIVDRHPGQLRLLGGIPHQRLLVLQRQTDILVNIANADPAQIPGKVFEYLGACRPILHLQAQEGDAVCELLAGLARGWSCMATAESVAGVLHRLVALAADGRLEAALELDAGRVQAWSWTALARKVENVLVSPASQ